MTSLSPYEYCGALWCRRRRRRCYGRCRLSTIDAADDDGGDDDDDRPWRACLSAELVGQTSATYKKIGKHFDSINLNNASSDALRSIFLNMLYDDDDDDDMMTMMMTTTTTMMM